MRKIVNRQQYVVPSTIEDPVALDAIKEAAGKMNTGA
jgi:hypothetical protein